MKVSIIVPVYNAEKYIDDCIKSVVNQTNSNWELVLIDDGSTDKSLDICKKYKKNYDGQIKVYHKKNEGQYLTRICGIKESTGEYIGFLDADDFLDLEYVDTVIKYANNNNPQVMCFGFYIWDEGIQKEISVLENSQDILYVDLKERQYVYEQIISGELTGSMWSKVFNASILKNHLLEDSVVKGKRYAEDAFQSFSIMAEVENILYINKKLYFYRNNANGASKGEDKRELDYYNSKYVFEVIKNSLAIWEMETDEYLKKLYARNFNETVYHLLKYYRSAKTLKRKEAIVKYDWDSYLMEGFEQYMENNEYIRESFIRVWRAFAKQKVMEIYFREKFRKFIGW